MTLSIERPPDTMTARKKPTHYRLPSCGYDDKSAEEDPVEKDLRTQLLPRTDIKTHLYSHVTRAVA